MDDWKRNELPTDEQALQNALILRSCSEDRTRAWPLLIDPHNQAEIWIRALHQGNFFLFSGSVLCLNSNNLFRHSKSKGK